ncbi:hypothetical protein [Streptantibioticus ferralitis]|uniref:Uncharacterized protein n=1 Tax=Streptantibioticus ferralitis TaxID=236510 RepID=A0ABT5Z3N1_9ACTN|nr:hypothetical protein [Streptantibioticus ferralitis]MDF2258373.1 hypothetical protein [Streptantibioticus ferralitis]
MSNSNPVKGASQNGSNVTADDMARVAPGDFTDLQRMARGYCRAVDSTRSRKRMNGSATVVRSGRALYGTDDVSDDVTQDAVLIFAKRLREIVTSYEVAALWVETREPSAWQYIRRDGETIIVTRKTLQYWAVRDAAARNGYRLDVKPDEIDAVPSAQLMRGIPHADKLSTLAVTPYLSGNSATIFRQAWGDGSEYPTLKRLLRHASQAEDLGRAGVIGKTAQDLYGGPRNSSSKVQRTRDTGVKEWRTLTARLDEVRENLIYRSTRTGDNS